jgi:putative Holliday junction resolvase
LRVLALDIGEKRIGIAVGDTGTKIAIPISILRTEDVLHTTKPFKTILEDNEPELLLVGLPLSLDGEENQQTARVKALATTIAQTLDLPLVYQDERLSSVEAKRYLREAGCTEREMRGKIDMIAASLILQAYLDRILSSTQ